MEIVEIINNGSLGQNQWGQFFSLDGGDLETRRAEVYQDLVVAPVEAQAGPQYYVVEGDGSVLTLVEGNNFTFLTQEEDDEIPSYKLDHMYAKKPREPGTELVKPTRRRSKKKELLKNQYYVQEMMYDPPPKINIIRGRHAANSVGYSRPKILTSPQKSPLPSTNIFANNSKFTSLNSISPYAKQSSKYEDVSEAVIFEEYDEYNAPSPGAVVTVCDGIEMDPVVLTARTGKPRKFNYNPSGQSPSYIENRNSSLDSIGDPEDESELFLDFPMEEEEEVDSTIDVDFSEISTSTSNALDMIRSVPVTFQSSTEQDDSDFSIALADPSLGPHVHVIGSKVDETVFGESTFGDMRKSNLVKQVHSDDIVVGALSAVTDELLNFTDCVNGTDMEKETKESTVRQSAQSGLLIPTRRSTRPIKAPSRLDDVEDISSIKRRRR